MPNFTGKVAIITGSFSGIGQATAVLFAKLGANLCLTDRYEMDETKKKCIEAGISPDNIITVVVDLLEEKKISTIYEKCTEKFGKVDMLINIAGTTLEEGSIRAPITNFDIVMQVNCRSIILLTQLCLDQLIANKGAIVSVSSVAAVLQFPCIYYCMSKCALDQFTKCLAVDMAPLGVRVNNVNPGQIDTPLIKSCFHMTDAEDRAYMNDMAEKHPTQRVGQPIEVAKAIAFLASDDASFTTGQTLFVDGAVSLTNNIATKPADVK